MANKEKNQPQKNIRDFQNHTSKGSKVGKYLWRKFLESPLSTEFSTKGWLAGQNFSECGEVEMLQVQSLIIVCLGLSPALFLAIPFSPLGLDCQVKPFDILA